MFIECLLCAGGDGRLVIYVFIQQIFIEHPPKAKGDKHLSFLCSFIHYIFIEYVLYYMLMGDEGCPLTL